jgi:hypothetical protein
VRRTPFDAFYTQTKRIMATLLNQLSLIVTHTAVQLGAGLIIGSVCEVVFDSQHLTAPTSWSDFLSASVLVGSQLLLNAMFVAAAISYAMVPGLADPAGMFVFL